MLFYINNNIVYVYIDDNSDNSRQLRFVTMNKLSRIVVLYSIQQSVVFLLLFLCETLFQQSGWHTADDGVRRKRLRYHCSGCNDRAVTYGDTLQYCHIRTYPHVILDYYCSIIFRQFLIVSDVNDVFA